MRDHSSRPQWMNVSLISNDSSMNVGRRRNEAEKLSSSDVILASRPFLNFGAIEDFMSRFTVDGRGHAPNRWGGLSVPCYLDACIQKQYQFLSFEMNLDAA